MSSACKRKKKEREKTHRYTASERARSRMSSTRRVKRERERRKKKRENKKEIQFVRSIDSNQSSLRRVTVDLDGRNSRNTTRDRRGPHARARGILVIRRFYWHARANTRHRQRCPRLPDASSTIDRSIGRSTGANNEPVKVNRSDGERYRSLGKTQGDCTFALILRRPFTDENLWTLVDKYVRYRSMFRSDRR